MRNTFAPTVLLLDETSQDGVATTTKVWLQKRGYNVKQVNCLTDAVERTIDFTLGTRPSLILLNFGQALDINEEKLRLLQDITDFEDIPLIALSDSSDDFIGDKILTIETLEALQPLMNNLRANTYAKAA